MSPQVARHIIVATDGHCSVVCLIFWSSVSAPIGCPVRSISAERTRSSCVAHPRTSGIKLAR